MQTFNRQNIQEPKYGTRNMQTFNSQNIQEANCMSTKIQTCRQKCGNTIEFVNQFGLNMVLEDISKYFEKFGNIVQILKFNVDKQSITVYYVEFLKKGSVDTVFQQKKPHIIKSRVYEYLKGTSINILRQSTNNHLHGCNYSIQNQTNDGK